MRLLSVICLLTERGIVLSQAEQFDILDLHKKFTQDLLSFVLVWVDWKKNTLVSLRLKPVLFPKSKLEKKHYSTVSQPESTLN